MVKQDFVMFNKSFSNKYDDNTELYGGLHDDTNRDNIGMTLCQTPETLFVNHNEEILISLGKSLGIMHYYIHLVKNELQYQEMDEHVTLNVTTMKSFFKSVTMPLDHEI